MMGSIMYREVDRHAAHPVKTLGELLEWSVQELKVMGIGCTRLDAEVLMAFLLNKDRPYLYTYPDYELTPEEIGRFHELIERRCSGEPVAYLTGIREFMGLPFRVNRHVLIPRPETELLVEKVIEFAGTHFHELHSPAYMLDIGTGSGCIPIASAYYTTNLDILSVDINSFAIQTAQYNVKLNHLDSMVPQRLRFQLSDLFGYVSPEVKERGFDLIVSNPPYIPGRISPNSSGTSGNSSPMKHWTAGRMDWKSFARLYMPPRAT